MEESFCNRRLSLLSALLIMHNLVVYNVYLVANGQPQEIRKRMSFRVRKVAIIYINTEST